MASNRALLTSLLLELWVSPPVGTKEVPVFCPETEKLGCNP